MQTAHVALCPRVGIEFHRFACQQRLRYIVDESGIGDF